MRNILSQSVFRLLFLDFIGTLHNMYIQASSIQYIPLLGLAYIDDCHNPLAVVSTSFKLTDPNSCCILNATSTTGDKKLHIFFPDTVSLKYTSIYKSRESVSKDDESSGVVLLYLALVPAPNLKYDMEMDSNFANLIKNEIKYHERGRCQLS